LESAHKYALVICSSSSSKFQASLTEYSPIESLRKAVKWAQLQENA